MIAPSTWNWTSSNESIATVIASGVANTATVTALGSGIATITADYLETTPPVIGSTKLNVSVAGIIVTQVAITPTQLEVISGTNAVLTAVAMDASGNVVTTVPGYWAWASSNTSVAIVNGSGINSTAMLTGGNAGASVITATYTENATVVSGTENVTITPNGRGNNTAALDKGLLDFCIAHLGQKVGDGQCSTLVWVAQEAVGARTGFPDYPIPGEYVWGSPVCVIGMHGNTPVITVGNKTELLTAGNIGYIQPGHIMQFQNVVIKYRNGNFWWNEDAQHHTAVVKDILPDQIICNVVEQNAGHLWVTLGKYYLSGMDTGEIRIYQCLPK